MLKDFLVGMGLIVLMGVCLALGMHAVFMVFAGLGV